MNQQAYRFMYSPVCKIMTVHNVILNPFSLSENRVRRDGNIQQNSVFPSGNGGISRQEYTGFLQEYTNTNQNTFYETEDQDQEPTEGNKNRVTTHD